MSDAVIGAWAVAHPGFWWCGVMVAVVVPVLLVQLLDSWRMNRASRRKDAPWRT